LAFRSQIGEADRRGLLVAVHQQNITPLTTERDGEIDG
jgi:hypothetical protein